MIFSFCAGTVMYGAQAGDPTDDGLARLAALRRLNNRLLSGDIPTYYSDGQLVRARYLQSLLGEEIRFYEDGFGIHLSTITMAVINPKQWASVSGDLPYGMPSMSDTTPYVFVMPTTWHEVTWMPFPKQSDVDSVTLRHGLAAEGDWEALQFAAGDGIGTHEIGHSIILQLGIKPPTKWLNELLASYAGYAYLKSKRPKEVLANEIFWTAGLKTTHSYTSLRDFESKYDELLSKHPANYCWYQFAFDQRMMAVYQKEGLNFLREMQAAFPSDGPTLNEEQVLEKLASMDNGWRSWAAELERGDVKATKLTYSYPADRN